MDKDQSSVIDKNDVKGVYNAAKHPDVLTGAKTEDQVLKEFLMGFEGTRDDGKITWQEWQGEALHLAIKFIH